MTDWLSDRDDAKIFEIGTNFVLEHISGFDVRQIGKIYIVSGCTALQTLRESSQ
jgi:hypothetical protein